MCTDTSLAAIEIVRLYGLRFKIEHTFKQAVRLIGSFSYHFWMSDMKPLRRRSGNQHLHRASPEYRDAVRRKLHAYHVFIQAAVVCQGLLQDLAVAFPQRVLARLRLLAAHHPALESRPRSWSWPVPCATACRNFSEFPPQATSSRNSSSNDRTPIKWRHPACAS